MTVVRTIMHWKHHDHVALLSCYVATVWLVLILGMFVTPMASASVNGPSTFSQSPGQVQVRLNAAVSAVVNGGNATTMSGAGLTDSNGAVAAPNAVQLHLIHLNSLSFSLCTGYFIV